MRKLLALVLVFILALAACGNNGDNSNSKDAKEDTKSYTTDDGKKVKIPKNPKRIVVLGTTYAGGLKELDANIQAVAKNVDDSSVLKDKFKDVKKIDPENVEAVAKEKPDLIITYNTDKNLKKLKKSHQLSHSTI